MGNLCLAGCDGYNATDACTSGECREPSTTESGRTTDSGCICTEEYDPVCCSDGSEFSNACKAACDGYDSCEKGRCSATTEEPCVCTKELNPWCCEGTEFGNPCLAECGVYDTTTSDVCLNRECLDDVSKGYSVYFIGAYVGLAVIFFQMLM